MTGPRAATTGAESGVLLGTLPGEVRVGAEGLGLKDADCLFALPSDIDLNGRAEDVWLIVTRTDVVAIADSPEGGRLEAGPFPFAKIQKARLLQTVGSAFLQVMVGGLYVDVVRFSNGRREFFHRARMQIERILEGQPLETEHLTKPSDVTCPRCGMPLPGRGTPCRMCQAGHGIMLRSVELMAPYRASITLLMGLMILRVTVSLVPPYLVRVLVDGVLQPTPGAALLGDPGVLLLTFVLALLAVHAVQCVLNIGIGRASTAIGTRITREMREMLQSKLLQLDVSYYDRHSVGGLMSRVLYDTDYFQSFVDQVAGGFLLNVLQVFGICVMLFVLNPFLAFLVMLPVPLVVVGTLLFLRHVRPRYWPVWESQSKMSQLMSGVLSGVRLVKAFGQEKREEKRFSESAEYLLNARRALNYSVATFHPLMQFAALLGSMIIWYAGGKLVIENRLYGAGISLGVLMAFFNYVGMFYGPIQMLSQFSNWMTGFVSAAQRIFEVMDADVVLKESPSAVRVPDMRGEIELRNVSFGYDQHNPIIKNVSLKINPGQFVGIVGKSGSGKTTLVNLICRFYDVQQGQVLIDGIDVREISQVDLHSHVSLVLQEPFLFRSSIRDNLAYGNPEASPKEVMDGAKAANAHDFIARMPGGYDRKVGERGAGLSGGERQRITIARALVRDPRVLILDEATSSVDTESEQEIQRALATLGKGRTTIVIAHRLSTLKSADHIFVMDEGQIAESGSHEELMALGGIYCKLVRIQTELTRLEL